MAAKQSRLRSTEEVVAKARIFEQGDIAILPEMMRAAIIHLDGSLKSLSDRGALQMIVQSSITLQKNLEQRLTSPGTNPKVSAAFSAKRAAEKFKVKSRLKGEFEIIGWDNLISYTGLKESYIRNKFSGGGGSFKMTKKTSDGELDDTTITRQK